MRRALVAVLIGAGIVCVLAAPAAAQNQRIGRREFANGGASQLGGQILPNRNALAAGGLYPSFWFQFTLGMSRNFDLGFRGDLYYASPLEYEYGPGLGFSIPMRIGLAQGGKVSVALKLAPSVIAGEFEDDELDGRYCRVTPSGWRCWNDPDDFYDGYNDDDFGVGLGCEFGVLLGIPVKIVNIIVGITSPFYIVFFEDHDGADFYFPVAGFGGAEVRLTERLNVFGLLQPGITFHSNENDSEMEGYFRFWAGIEYAL